MSIIDLTLPVPQAENNAPLVRLQEVPLFSRGENVTGMVYHFTHNSMVGTYIDFPGHIKETDDGLDACSYPVEKLFRVRAGVIHLNRRDQSGGVTAEELATAAPDLSGCGALILNALGETPFDGIVNRSVFLKHDATEWIAKSGVHLLVSDVYESRTLSEGNFPLLFRHGVSTVCQPAGLHHLTAPHVLLTVLAPRYRGVTQVSCRVLAEIP